MDVVWEKHDIRAISSQFWKKNVISQKFYVELNFLYGNKDNFKYVKF